MKKRKNNNQQFAYTIDDKYFGKLGIIKSANAWWIDRGKVERLVMGYKMDCKVQECRLLAGITKDQLDYFNEKHPEFSAILDDMRKMPTIKARVTLMRALEQDANLAFKYLERKEPDEFKERKDIEFSEPQKMVINDLIDTEDEAPIDENNQ